MDGVAEHARAESPRGGGGDGAASPHGGGGDDERRGGREDLVDDFGRRGGAVERTPVVHFSFLILIFF